MSARRNLARPSSHPPWRPAVGVAGGAVGDGSPGSVQGWPSLSRLRRRWARRSAPAAAWRRQPSEPASVLASRWRTAAAGRGVLVGVGVAAGAAGPQAAKVAPATITRMISRKGQAVLIVRRDRIINVHLRICQSLSISSLFRHPLQDAIRRPIHDAEGGQFGAGLRSCCNSGSTGTARRPSPNSASSRRRA